MALHGPDDPTLWITRELGYWENQLFGNLDHTSNCNILMNTCIQSDNIDPAKLEEAVRALIYNQPNFRTDVRRGEDGRKYFTPATDFSDVFEFIDQSGDTGGVTGYAGCWDLSEKLVNTPFSCGSGAPLHKCYLVKRPDCYIQLNRFHHGIGDGTTGFHIINEILRQYDLLVSGKEVDLSPAAVLISGEDMSKFVKNDELVEKMIEGRVERAKVQKMLLPLNREELAASQAGNPWLNKTLHAVGTVEGLTKLKALCRRSGVTVGCYSFAALFYSIAAVHIKRNGGEFPEEGVPTLYTDVVASLRSRVEPDPGDESFMLCIAEVEATEKIEKETTLFQTTRKISQQLKSCIEEKRFALFASYKEGVETGKHSEYFNSHPEGTYCEFLPSNQVRFKYPTKYSWGEMTTTHSLGSYWCPFFANQVVLYHSVNGALNYTTCCCDGDNNCKDAQEVQDLFVSVMENADMVNENTRVMDIVHFNTVKE